MHNVHISTISWANTNETVIPENSLPGRKDSLEVMMFGSILFKR